MTPNERAFKLLKQWYRTPEDHDVQEAGIADAIRAAVEEEREACAKLAEETRIVGAMGIMYCRGVQVAKAIRKRGQL